MKPFFLLFSLVAVLAGCQPEPVSLAVTDVSLGEPGSPATMTSVQSHPSLENMDRLAHGMTPEEIIALLGPPTQLLPTTIRYVVNHPGRPKQEYYVLPLYGGRLAGNARQWKLHTTEPLPKQGTLERFWWNYGQSLFDFVDAQDEKEELYQLWCPMSCPNFEPNPTIAHTPTIMFFDRMNADLAAMTKTNPMDTEEVARLTKAVTSSRHLASGLSPTQMGANQDNPSDNKEERSYAPLLAEEQKDVDDLRKQMRLARAATIKDRADTKEGELEYEIWNHFQRMNPNTRSFAELVIEALNHPHQAVILPGLMNARLAPAKPVIEACMVLVFHPCPEIRAAAARMLPRTPRAQLLRKQSKEAANDASALQSLENIMRKIQQQDTEKKKKARSE